MSANPIIIIGEELHDGVQLPSGLVVPRYIADAQRPVMTGISLFSGIGGMDLGFIQAGCHVLCAVEYDCAAVFTYMVNLCRWGEVQMHFVTPADRERMEKYIERTWKGEGAPSLAGSGLMSKAPRLMHSTPHVVVGDIRQATGEWLLGIVGMERGEVDCVFGGPPCQGYSHAGRRDVMDPRNSLVFEWARLVCEIQPRTCIMENVPGIMSMVTEAGLPVVEELLLILEKGGFGARDLFRRCVEAQIGIKLMRGRPVKGADRSSDHEEEPADLFSFAESTL